MGDMASHYKPPLGPLSNAGWHLRMGPDDRNYAVFVAPQVEPLSLG